MCVYVCVCSSACSQSNIIALYLESADRDSEEMGESFYHEKVHCLCTSVYKYSMQHVHIPYINILAYIVCG